MFNVHFQQLPFMSTNKHKWSRMDVSGRIAIITGGAQGLGYGFTEALLNRGANVVIADIDSKAGLEAKNVLTAQHGIGRVQFIYCNVVKKDQFRNLFEKTKEFYGNIDIVVNNAGIANEAELELMVQINLIGVITGTQLAMEYMSKDNGGRGGLIVNVGSTAALTVVAMEPHYSATKAGVVAYTRSIAGSTVHTTDQNIRLVCLCPSFTATRILSQGLKSVLNSHEGVQSETDLHKMLIDNVGIMKVERVVESFLKLVDDPANNGGVLAVSPKSVFYRYPKGMTGKL